jgi:hypothetical protein
VGDPGYSHAPQTVEGRRQAVAASEASLGAARRDERYRRGQAMSDDDEDVAYTDASIRDGLDEGAR